MKNFTISCLTKSYLAPGGSYGGWSSYTSCNSPSVNKRYVLKVKIIFNSNRILFILDPTEVRLSHY